MELPLMGTEKIFEEAVASGLYYTTLSLSTRQNPQDD
jgi:hypothetical protein